MDELVIDNLVYIPSRKAAEITGYAKDYVGQLCREGRIEAKLVGRSWYVLESSIREHRFGATSEGVSSAVEEQKEEIAPEVEEVSVVETSAPETFIADGPLPSWEPATYSVEEPRVLEESRQTTYLENTIPDDAPESNQSSQVQEVQNAWQEWFSKNERVQTVDVPAVEVEEDKEKEESVPEPVMIRKTETVRMAAQPIESPYTPSARDIEPVARAESRKQGGRSARTQKPAGRVLKAVFIGVIILTLAVTVIGTGSLDALSPSWASKGSAIDYLAGVRNFSR